MARDPLIGRKLGDYTIESLLGRGGMSRVYVGYDEYLDRYAAVKVISDDLTDTDEAEYARRFQTEARAIARLRHPHIVGIYQFGRSAGIYYMAQVLLEGADLRVLLKAYADRGLRMPVPEIVRVVRDIASALDYAHEQGVIHRDIKPSNIILECMTGRAILMDFGLALSVPEGTLGDTFGSAHYIAPEQAISSAKAVPQSDLYALGVVVYEMATGTVPFDDPSVMSVALKHLNDPPPPPTVHNPDLPPAVEQVILRALEKDPARRYRTGAAFADALQRAYEDAPAHLHAGPSIAELMAWQGPSPEALRTPPSEFPLPEPFASEPLSSRPTPPPVVPYVPPVPGVASRFAQRRQQKEAEEALRAIADGDLALDENALEDLLDSYDEPREMGLEGPRAAPVVPPLLAERPAAESGAGRAARPRRRLRLLLVVLILLAVAAGVILLGTRGGDRDGETGAGVSAVALSASDTPAPTTPPPTATRAPTATSQPTDSPVAAATELGAALVTGAPTESPTASPTASPTDTPPPSATATFTEAPSATPTAAPSATPTASPTAPPVEAAAPEAPPGPPPALRLVYERDALLLVNVSGGALDVSGLVFEQIPADGPARLFRASTWDREGMADPPGSMRDGGCYQVVTKTATQTQPDRALCPEFLGYVRLEGEQRYFWDGASPDAVFTVRLAGADAPLTVCAVAVGECGVMLEAAPPAPSPSAPPTPTPSATSVPSPTATPTPLPPDVWLLYDGDQVWLVNVSGEEQDISGLVFEQLLPDGTVRRFEAQQWNRPDALALPAQMPAGGGFQLVTGDGTRASPDSAGCERLLGWFRTGVPSRYFWLADDPGAVFTVRRADATAPLATCAVAAGECAFSLAAE